MRVAISGSNGLIGGALSDLLRKHGDNVTAIERVRVCRDGNSARGAAAIEWMPENGLCEPNRLEEVDAVIHLAGKSIADGRWNEKTKTAIRQSRVEATNAIVEQCLLLASPPKHFLCASAIGIYGDTGDRWVTEASLPGNDFLAKVAEDWEIVCQPLVQRGVRVLHLRFGIVLSPKGGALKKVLPLFSWGVGGKLGTGNQYWSWVALEDVVQAICFLLHDKSEASGSFNFVAPNPVTNADFTRQLAKAVGRPACLPAPSFALRLALGEMADALLLSSCRVAPHRLTEELGYSFMYPTLERYLSQAIAVK